MEELCNKYLLTINEAIYYFNIGRHKLIELTKEQECDFVNYVGKKILINRKKFEEFLSVTKYL